MKRKAKETIRRGRQKRYGLLLLFFAVLLFLNTAGHPSVSEAGVSTSQEIRVGLKNKFSGKQSITLYNTSLELGYCDGREFFRETEMYSENGVTVTPETTAYHRIDGTFALSQAEALAERLTKAGAKAYAVMVSSGKAEIYLPVSENGSGEAEALRNCKQAAQTCNVTVTDTVKKSEYLLRITAGERVLFADGADGYYPQFAATRKDEDGLYAVDLGERSYRGRIEIGRYGGRSSLTAVNVVP